MFSEGFPQSLLSDVKQVIALMPRKTYSNVSIGVSEQTISYTLSGNDIRFPYRVYYQELADEAIKQLNENQQHILHCIYSRSCDGFVRERHIKDILASSYPDWAIPYIFKVCDEYVIEILQSVYDLLKNRESNNIKDFCLENQDSFCKSYNRMISYWNEYYRGDCYRYKNYIGRALFLECFGYTRSMEHRKLEAQ